MVRPLDHVTVLQQISLAGREHQHLQSHPELSRLAAESVQREKQVAESRQARPAQRSERTRRQDRPRRPGRRREEGGSST